MKKVKKNVNQIPLALIKKDKKLQKLLKQRKEERKLSDYSSEELKAALEKIYNGKCAYCEKNSDLQIEHYRPKGNIKDVEKHQGYYWLTYEWTNLIYACSGCNQTKSTHFPIEGKRIYEAPLQGETLNKEKCKLNCTDLLNEKPLILNPEESNFNPKLYFIISPNGKLYPKRKNTRGKETIKRCDLNRKSLILARKKLVDEHFRKMYKDFEKFETAKIDDLKTLEALLEKEIEGMLDRILQDLEYTFLAKGMLKHFEYFFTRRFQDKEQIILRRVYQKVRTKLKK